MLQWSNGCDRDDDDDDDDAEEEEEEEATISVPEFQTYGIECGPGSNMKESLHSAILRH